MMLPCLLLHPGCLAGSVPEGFYQCSHFVFQDASGPHQFNMLGSSWSLELTEAKPEAKEDWGWLR